MATTLKVATCLWAVVLVAATLACNSPEKKAEPPPAKTVDATEDRDALDQLQAAGSNLTKPHHIEFYLIVPTKEDAESAETLLRTMGFAVSVSEGENGTSWVCTASRTMVPKIQDLAGARVVFDNLAQKYRGAYGGWDASIEH